MVANLHDIFEGIAKNNASPDEYRTKNNWADLGANLFYNDFIGKSFFERIKDVVTGDSSKVLTLDEIGDALADYRVFGSKKEAMKVFPQIVSPGKEHMCGFLGFTELENQEGKKVYRVGVYSETLQKILDLKEDDFN